jgi:uncharacterized membrane protein YqjE
MLSTILKFITIYIMNQRIAQTKHNVNVLSEQVADYAESRVTVLKRNLLEDLERMANSFLGFLFMFLALSFSGMVAIMWLFAVAWNSPNREFILGGFILIPLIISAFVYKEVRSIWKKTPFMKTSTDLIAQDWQVFRYGLDGTADISDEANN